MLRPWTLSAQSLLIQLTEGELPPPDLWRHDRSGSLSCAYDGGERVFTWPPGDVAAMARRWRGSGTSRVPDQARPFLDAHQRLEAVATKAGLGPADVVIHDLPRAELCGMWTHHKMVVTVDEIPGRVHSAVI
jgi:hypothetical protein